MNLLPSVYDPDCQRCGLCKLRTNIVPSYLPDTTEILFLTEAPGTIEDRSGTRPLIGAAGKSLSSLIKAAGFKVFDERIGYANTVRCMPKETNEKNLLAGKTNRPPRDAEIKACSGYLDAEIKSLPNLKVIICLGAIAVKRIFGKVGMSMQEIRGKVLLHDTYGKVIVTHHPARLLHVIDSREKALLTSDIQSDLRKAKNLIEGVEEKKEVKVTEHKIVKNIIQARWVLDQLMKTKIFSFDTETSNFDPFDSILLCFSFSWKLNTGYCLPLVRYACEEIWSDEERSEIMAGLVKVFFNPSSKKVAQNAKFDLQHLRFNGIEVNNLYADTMLMSYLLNENGSHGLKEMAWMYTDVGGYDDVLDAERERVAKERGCTKGEVSFQYLNTELLWKYAAFDADVTFRLMYILWPKLVKENLVDVLRNVFMPICVMLTNVEYGGVSVDKSYLDSMILEYRERINSLNEKILNDKDVVKYVNLQRTQYKVKRLEKYNISKNLKSRFTEKEYCEKGIESVKFNAKSSKQLRELFIDMLHMPIIQKTDKGNAQLNAAVLEIYAERRPIAKTLSYQNKLKQLSSTFLVGIKGKLRADSKLHSTFSQHLSVTARLTSRGPNLQNIPNKDKNPKESKEIRNLFVGDTDDDVIIEADLGQAEFRVWGLLAHDEIMYEDLRQGIDIHRKFASIGYEIPEDEVTDEQRSPTKGVIFGTIYGRSPKSVAIQLNMPEAKAKKVQQALFNRYRKSADWLERTVKSARENGYTVGFFGNRRHLQDTINHPDIGVRAHAERQAKNSPVQGSASLMNCLAGVKIEQEFKEKHIQGRILSFIHDAILVNVKKGQALEAYKIMHHCMTHPHPTIDVPLTADFKVGKKWGTAVKTKTEDDFKGILKMIDEMEKYSIFISGDVAWAEKEPFEFVVVEGEGFLIESKGLNKEQAYQKLKYLESVEGLKIEITEFQNTDFYSILTHQESGGIWLEKEPFDLSSTNDGNVNCQGYCFLYDNAVTKMKEYAKKMNLTIIEN